MEKKIAGLLGAMATLGAFNAAQAAPIPTPAPSDVLRANSFAELLQPIPNAAALLKAVDESRPNPSADENVQLAQFYHHSSSSSSPPPPQLLSQIRIWTRIWIWSRIWIWTRCRGRAGVPPLLSPSPSSSPPPPQLLPPRLLVSCGMTIKQDLRVLFFCVPLEPDALSHANRRHPRIKSEGMLRLKTPWIFGCRVFFTRTGTHFARKRYSWRAFSFAARCRCR